LLNIQNGFFIPLEYEIKLWSRIKWINFNIMGKIKQNLFGGFSGKVGPIVGGTWKSVNYIRAKAAKVSNPRTEKQQNQRGKFAIAFNFLKSIAPFIRIGYQTYAQEKTPFNAAMSYMLKKAIKSDETGAIIDFKRVMVSTGSLMPVFEGKATKKNCNMLFDWVDNSGMGNAETSDVAMLLVYNKDKETAVYNTIAAIRSDAHAELALPENWDDDELFPYLSFINAEGDSVANSICLSLSARTK